jgi:hypothetical protein
MKLKTPFKDTGISDILSRGIFLNRMPCLYQGLSLLIGEYSNKD